MRAVGSPAVVSLGARVVLVAGARGGRGRARCLGALLQIEWPVGGGRALVFVAAVVVGVTGASVGWWDRRHPVWRQAARSAPEGCDRNLPRVVGDQRHAIV